MNLTHLLKKEGREKEEVEENWTMIFFFFFEREKEREGISPLLLEIKRVVNQEYSFSEILMIWREKGGNMKE